MVAAMSEQDAKEMLRSMGSKRPTRTRDPGLAMTDTKNSVRFAAIEGPDPGGVIGMGRCLLNVVPGLGAGYLYQRR